MSLFWPTALRLKLKSLFYASVRVRQLFGCVWHTNIATRLLVPNHVYLIFFSPSTLQQCLKPVFTVDSVFQNVSFVVENATSSWLQSQNQEKKKWKCIYHCRHGQSQLVCILEHRGGSVQWESGQTVCSLARWGLLPLHALSLQYDLLWI